MSQRSKASKQNKKKCISASNSPTRWKGQGRDASEPKKMGFRVFKGKRSKEATVHNWGRFSPDFSSFKWSLIGHLLKKICGRPIGKIIFPKYFSVENSN